MNALDCLYIPVAIVSAPAWAGKKREGWGERFGKVEPLPEKTRPRVMLHAVSVGEVSALRTLVPLLVDHAEVVVTATTDTGLRRAKELFGATCRVVRYPLDFSWAVRRFLRAVKPDVVALVELEVWPNFVHACLDERVPVCVINGRLSERSLRGYMRIRRYFGRLLRRLEFVAVQDDTYARRFVQLGLLKNSCLITGSMKWDSAGASTAKPPAADELRSAMGIDASRPLIVAGSTGPGEEELLHRACPDGVQLLCAPRKPERFDEAARALPGCVRRSAPGSGSPSSGRFLLDTIGELRQAYSLADVAVVGRSFGDQFGSDPIEPIGLGKATVIGPAVQDFASIVQAFEAARGIERASRDTLGSVLAGLVTDRERRERLAANGLRCIAESRGASARHADLVLSLVRHGAGGNAGVGASDPGGVTRAPGTVGAVGRG